MSFNYRFEPPTNSELDDLLMFEYECDHNCNDCFWSCEVYPDEGDNIQKEPSIDEDMQIQNAIDEALEKICKKYNIVIVNLDYLWDYKE